MSIRILLCALILGLWYLPVMAEDTPTTSAPREASKPLTVDLLDGAETAEAALKALVAASKAADDEAALMMVDPPIRRLLAPEIAIERYMAIPGSKNWPPRFRK